MSKKTKEVYASDKVLYAFIGECGGPEITSTTIPELEQEYQEYKDSLNEISCMILHFQDLGNSSEVAFWRRFLMHNKMVMREIKKKIMDANINHKEIVYS